MKLEVIIEKNDDMLWGRIEDKGDFLPATGATTTGEVLDNLRMLIEDYQLHEGKKDKFWKKVATAEIRWDIHYDLQAFFEQHDYLNITAVAKRARLSPILVRHYAAGIKHPSAVQAKKLECTIHEIAEELKQVHMYAV